MDSRGLLLPLNVYPGGSPPVHSSFLRSNATSEHPYAERDSLDTLERDIGDIVNDGQLAVSSSTSGIQGPDPTQAGAEPSDLHLGLNYPTLSFSGLSDSASNPGTASAPESGPSTSLPQATALAIILQAAQRHAAANGNEEFPSFHPSTGDPTHSPLDWMTSDDFHGVLQPYSRQDGVGDTRPSLSPSSPGLDDFNDITDMLNHLSSHPDAVIDPALRGVVAASHFVTRAFQPPSEPDEDASEFDFDVEREREDAAGASTVHTGVRRSSARRRAFVCEQCGKTWTRPSDLQRHVRTHTGERPFVCGYPRCTRSFIQRSALRVHERIHSGVKPYECEYPGCDKGFGDSSSLARHRRTHAERKAYVCEHAECTKEFTRRGALKEHMRTHDPDWEEDPNVRYDFRGKRHAAGPEESLEASLATLSALLGGVSDGGQEAGDAASGTSAHALAEQVASALGDVGGPDAGVGGEAGGVGRAGAEAADVDAMLSHALRLRPRTDGARQGAKRRR